jgi:hypothetical protein
MPPPTAASVKATSIECMLTHTRAISRLYTEVSMAEAYRLRTSMIATAVAVTSSSRSVSMMTIVVTWAHLPGRPSSRASGR